MKALKLFSYFLSGGSSTTLLGWCLSFTPFAIRLGVYALIFGLLAIVLAMVLDDPISEFFDIELSRYYAILGGVTATILCGFAVLGGMLWL